MFPYLIAGAIGFVVAKLFEEDETPKYSDGGIVPTNKYIREDLYENNLEDKLYTQAGNYFAKKITDDYWHFSTQYFNGSEITYEVYSEMGGFWVNFQIKNNRLILSSIKLQPIIKDDIRFDGGGSTLLAPNGKPSNLTPEQYKLVRTPAFISWFGDWENSPENASKVIDENGEPLVCRHYSQKPIRFNEFTKQKANDTRNFISYAKEGFYFSTTDKNSIEKIYNRSKKGLLYEVFLNIKNILNLGNYNAYDFTTKKAVNWKEFTFKMLQKYVIKGRVGSFDDYTEYNANVDAFWMDEIDEKAKNKILKLGYNGVWGDKDKYADSISDEFYGTDQIVVFNSNQIKLADGTNTTFDGNNPDIRFASGGEIKKINELTEIDALKFAKKDWVDFKPSVINNGFCEIWAKHFKEIIGGEIKKTFISDGNTYSHTFIKYNNKYFDAEMPNGISDIMDLPYVKRWMKYADISPNNKIKKELLESIETRSLNYINKLIEDKIKSRKIKSNNSDIRFDEGGEVPKTSKDENGNWIGEYLGLKFILLNLREGWVFDIYFYSPIMLSEKTFFSNEDYEPFRTKKDALNSVIEKIIEINSENDDFIKRRKSNNPDIRFDEGGETTTYLEFYDKLKIEDGSKYIGQKFMNIFPFLGRRKVPQDFRKQVNQYDGVLKRLKEDDYSTKAMKQTDLNKLEKIKEHMDKKKYLSRFYLDSRGVIISFK